MSAHKESDFAEIIFDRLILESIPSESSAYHKDSHQKKRGEKLDKLRSRLLWHINHSLSERQKEVMKLILQGKKQAEIGTILGIKQQVVYIYKKRAIKKLKDIIVP